MNVVFVTRFAPAEVGHGGVHRSYQIAHDLQAAGQQVRVYQAESARGPADGAAPYRGLPGVGLGYRLRLLLRFAQYRGNPYRLLASILAHTFQHRRRFGAADVAAYERVLAQVGQPAVCVIDHPYFNSLLPANQARGIPTLACPQNLETFDLADLDVRAEWSRYAFIADFVAELNGLAACAERLFISRVEAALVGGLGLSARYYPYLPVGGVRANLLRLRQCRANGNVQPGLFVLLGSAAHAPTREGLEWFVRHAQAAGLPPGVRVVLAGLQTESLIPPGAAVPGLDARGWVEQAELDGLLQAAEAVLIPQMRGFGALTRLPELACAGVPVLVSPHNTHAIDLPPGVLPVPDDWPAWREHLSPGRLAQAGASLPDYTAWEARQPRPLAAALQAVTA